MLPLDVAIVVNIASTISALMALPQMIKILQNRGLIHALSPWSLLMQAVAAGMFAYADARLHLWLVLCETLISLSLIFGLGVMYFLKDQNKEAIPEDNLSEIQAA